MRNALPALLDRLDAYREALVKYGSHRPTCDVKDGVLYEARRPTCTCGYDAALDTEPT